MKLIVLALLVVATEGVLVLASFLARTPRLAADVARARPRRARSTTSRSRGA
jgi:hypothetical protein